MQEAGIMSQKVICHVGAKCNENNSGLFHPCPCSKPHKPEVERDERNYSELRYCTQRKDGMCPACVPVNSGSVTVAAYLPPVVTLKV